MCSTDLFLGLLALVFPPLPVWVKCGICSADSIINILLCMLGFLPGLLHSWYIIAKFPEPSYEYEGPIDSERGHVYVFVPEPNMNYGTNESAGAAPAAAPATAPAPAPAPQQQQSPAPGQVPHDAGEGSSGGPPPPSYAQAVSGDHKIQTQE